MTWYVLQVGEAKILPVSVAFIIAAFVAPIFWLGPIGGFLGLGTGALAGMMVAEGSHDIADHVRNVDKDGYCEVCDEDEVPKLTRAQREF